MWLIDMTYMNLFQNQLKHVETQQKATMQRSTCQSYKLSNPRQLPVIGCHKILLTMRLNLRQTTLYKPQNKRYKPPRKKKIKKKKVIVGYIIS